jgi:hypothetical protein
VRWRTLGRVSLEEPRDEQILREHGDPHLTALAHGDLPLGILGLDDVYKSERWREVVRCRLSVEGVGLEGVPHQSVAIGVDPVLLTFIYY